MELLFLIAFILYFVPAAIAVLRGKQNALAIIVLNLFLGWTFLGWVIALVWSVARDPAPAPRHYDFS
ncbi:MAG TPA: superinfection immunity protein [Candidatus Acidoferrum sp.]|nr:superinfection immunity protein [Candidatus Acidoferrum sp.]